MPKSPSTAIYQLYQKVKPGIFGLWQVSGRNDNGYEERVALGTRHVRNWSVWLGLVILTHTLRIVMNSFRP